MTAEATSATAARPAGRRLLEFLDDFVAVADERSPVGVIERALAVACSATGAAYAGALVFEDGDIVASARARLDEEQVVNLLRRPSLEFPLELGTFIERVGDGNHMPDQWMPEGVSVGSALVASIVCEGIWGAVYLAKPAGAEPFESGDEHLVRVLGRQAGGVLTTLRLLHERERESARKLESRFASLVKHSSDVTTLIDREGRFLYGSPSGERILGYQAEELLGTAALDLVHPDEQPRVAQVIVNAMKESAAAVFECRLRRKDGSWLQSETTINSLLWDPEVQGVVMNTRDITDRKRLEKQLTHQAFHDALTDLANRALFTDRVEHSLERAQRQMRPVGVLFLDLDNFKQVNDSLGHAAGDELLVIAAARLRECMRKSDTAARLGGDEFALLLEEMADPKDAEVVAERLLESFAEPFFIAGKEIVVHASVGVAVGGLGEYEADDLLRNADVAMYAAKGRGKNTYAIFESSMHASLVARIDLEADLRRAVENGEFTIHYQPTVFLQTGQISGMEALVRWNHPRRGLVPPLDFIPLAEETGLIVSIGRHVLREACKQARQWQLQHNLEMTVSVNLSARQLQHATLVEEVAEALAEAQLDPHCLILEITESVVMQHSQLVIGKLNELKELGVHIAIDDFGTGYSSLAYLQRLPVDILKIDRSFVAGLQQGSTEWAMTRAIIELGQSLNLKTVAEGIEVAEQLLHLQSLQCDLYQGFYFARPLSIEAMDEFLAETKQKVGTGSAASA